MSFHPNDVARRARMSSWALVLGFLFLIGAFFKTQVIQNRQYVMQSEENRLRPIPLPAPRGIIYDRHGEVIAENLPAYSVSITAPNVDSLRAALNSLAGTLQLEPYQINAAIRRYRRAPTRPTVVLPDASIDIVSVLEEHRLDFPRLIIQSVPKRYYPDGPMVASFVGYTGEITESDLNDPKYANYKPGQNIGKAGLEKQYESILHGREGVRFDEVDARGRPVRGEGPRPDLNPLGAPPLFTNIDLDLQKFMVGIFADSLQGGAVAIDPTTGEVLALYSAPSWDPNKFTGGIPADYYKELLEDKRRPLVNKAIQGRYPPGSTFKLATSVIALKDGLVGLKEHMPVPCSGGLQYGSRYFRCWEKKGHGSLDLEGAIKHSCDVYFYQLGLKVGLSRMIAGGISLTMRDKSGIDLPEENQPFWPYAIDYYNKKYGRNWSNAETLNLAIGQGANSQTVVNMAKLYTALATHGQESRPEIAHLVPQRRQLYKLTSQQDSVLLEGMKAVLEAGGTAGASAIQGLTLAGKTGTAQNSGGADHGWFVGFAPADHPKIVVAVLLEFGLHGSRAAHIASAIIGHYLKVGPIQAVMDEG
ncbi:MAG: penicillin-binding protein 2 [Gemmatimonadaceae bacterium]|jgi:penicillin-binding protein 2|nr:penicillin-binding protein 2 [Gemmatimonadaceae bacterium]MEA2764067.1 penicillin-binding protein 2 [Gemmatimonadaceae bacterium]